MWLERVMSIMPHGRLNALPVQSDFLIDGGGIRGTAGAPMHPSNFQASDGHLSHVLMEAHVVMAHI